MSTFTERMTAAERHELAVDEKLERAGWPSQPFGQCVFSNEMRTAIKSTKSPMRWLPDRIAYKQQRDGQWHIVLVDAKAGRSDTGNYSFEAESVNTMLTLMCMWRITAWFVTHDFRVIGPWAVQSRGEFRHPPPGSVNGSGTPFYLVKKNLAFDFANVFGSESR